jgi:hypothetical protein
VLRDIGVPEVRVWHGAAGGSLYPAEAHATVDSPTNHGTVSWSPAQLDHFTIRVPGT